MRCCCCAHNMMHTLNITASHVRRAPDQSTSTVTPPRCRARTNQLACMHASTTTTAAAAAARARCQTLLSSGGMDGCTADSRCPEDMKTACAHKTRTRRAQAGQPGGARPQKSPPSLLPPPLRCSPPWPPPSSTPSWLPARTTSCRWTASCRMCVVVARAQFAMPFASLLGACAAHAPDAPRRACARPACRCLASAPRWRSSWRRAASRRRARRAFAPLHAAAAMQLEIL